MTTPNPTTRLPLPGDLGTAQAMEASDGDGRVVVLHLAHDDVEVHLTASEARSFSTALRVLAEHAT